MTIWYFSFKLNEKPSDIPVLDCREVPNPFKLAETYEEKRLLVLANPLAHELIQAATVRHIHNGDLAIGCTWGKDRSRIIATAAAEFASTLARHISERPNAP